jgi:transcription elongation GreA/GreB family factor
MTALARSGPSPASWPMTSAALSALEAEIDSIRAEVSRFGAATTEDEEHERVEFRFVQSARRLTQLREIHAAAASVDAPGVAVIGRRVSLREDDGTAVTYAIVMPGDGDPDQGWVSAESPLGRALLGSRAGDLVTVVAPAGARRVAVTAVA